MVPEAEEYISGERSLAFRFRVIDGVDMGNNPIEYISVSHSAMWELEDEHSDGERFPPRVIRCVQKNRVDTHVNDISCVRIL